MYVLLQQCSQRCTAQQVHILNINSSTREWRVIERETKRTLICCGQASSEFDEQAPPSSRKSSLLEGALRAAGALDPPPLLPPPIMPDGGLRLFDLAPEEAWSFSTFWHLRAPPWEDIALLQQRLQVSAVLPIRYSTPQVGPRVCFYARDRAIQRIQKVLCIPLPLLGEFLTKGVIFKRFGSSARIQQRHQYTQSNAHKYRYCLRFR